MYDAYTVTIIYRHNSTLSFFTRVAHTGTPSHCIQVAVAAVY